MLLGDLVILFLDEVGLGYGIWISRWAFSEVTVSLCWFALSYNRDEC